MVLSLPSFASTLGTAQHCNGGQQNISGRSNRGKSTEFIFAGASGAMRAVFSCALIYANLCDADIQDSFQLLWVRSSCQPFFF